FVEFGDRVPFYGLVVLCADNAPLMRLAPRLGRRTMTYGILAGSIRAENLAFSPARARFDVTCDGRALGPIEMPLIGRHNVQNALAAIAVGIELEIPFAHAALALSRFQGVGRRFEKKGEGGGVLVIDDY